MELSIELRMLQYPFEEIIHTVLNIRKSWHLLDLKVIQLSR